MSWMQSLWNPFKKKEEGEGADPALSKELSSEAGGKGMAAFFYRKWKDPAFLKQMKVLAAHMAKDGVDLKKMDQVKAWLEKNKAAIESGALKEPPAEGEKPAMVVKTGPEVGRNDPCGCGSGKKFKKCCALKA